jgi:hypothetical protein
MLRVMKRTRKKRREAPPLAPLETAENVAQLLEMPPGLPGGLLRLPLPAADAASTECHRLVQRFSGAFSIDLPSVYAGIGKPTTAMQVKLILAASLC